MEAHPVSTSAHCREKHSYKGSYILKYMAGQPQEVSAMITHVPTHPAVTSPSYSTEKQLFFTQMSAQKHVQRGRESLGYHIKKQHWKPCPLIESYPAVFSQTNKRHALRQDHHCMRIAYFHFHLSLSAGICYLQTVERMKVIQFTRSTAPCEPAVRSPVFIETTINNKNLQGSLAHIHAVFSE